MQIILFCLTDYLSTANEKETCFSENLNFLINTPGCFIPNYAKTFMYNRSAVGRYAKRICGERAIFIDPIEDNYIEFRIDKEKLRLSNSKANFTCCYKFAIPSTFPGHELKRLQ